MPVSSNNNAPAFRRSLRWLAVVVWCGIIFAASHRANLRVADDDMVDLILRKAGHISVFAVLTWLLARALRSPRMSVSVALLLAWLGAFVYAISDEWHQTFITGRVGHPSDVMIDMIGATIAALVLHRCWTQTRSEDHIP